MILMNLGGFDTVPAPTKNVISGVPSDLDVTTTDTTEATVNIQKENMKEKLLRWIVAKPMQAASIIALVFAAIGFLIAKKITKRKR